jgi:hypothetical protein
LKSKRQAAHGEASKKQRITAVNPERGKAMELEAIHRKVKELKEEKNRLLANNKRKQRGPATSPKKSYKGQSSKKATKYPVVAKLKNFNSGKRGNTQTSHSLDSCSNIGGQSGVALSDPHGIGTWDSVTDVPPCETNALGQPIGKFWIHMQSYLHDRAPWLFKWHLPWPKQDKEMVRLFKLRVRSLYPGDYEEKFVLSEVANNIRQRRVRVRNHMKENGCKDHTPIAHGLSKESWDAIWDSISSSNYIEKSNKCKVAATERTRRISFTHRLGAGGVARLMSKFVRFLKTQNHSKL